MIDLRASPLASTFQQFVDNLRSPCLICTPYITAGPVERMLASVKRRGLQATLRLRVVTDLSLKNLIDGNTDIGALIRITEQVNDVAISYLPRVHAKVYISGEEFALFGSANFTDGGAYRNFEYMAAVSDPNLIRTIRSDVERYADLGGRISAKSLRDLERQVAALRDSVRAEQASIRAKLRESAAIIERRAEDQLLRTRIEGRSINGIFADTILYLLAHGPLSTIELESRVREIHPDLCDDALDRVIDGEHTNRIHYIASRRLWALASPM